LTSIRNTALYFIDSAPYMSCMDTPSPHSHILGRLRNAGLRPTRQRLALAGLLFDVADRHVTAEQLHGEAIAASIRCRWRPSTTRCTSSPTAGLLREVVVEPGRSYFDTNIDDHHHFFCESTGMLQDIPGTAVMVGQLPHAPAGTEISRVDVIIRVRRQTGHTPSPNLE
jgi:Fur family iron response transcriptional regulator